MGRKSDEREKRRALSIEKFEASKPAIVAKVGFLGQPKVQAEVVDDGAPRVAPHLARLAALQSQLPKTIFEGSRFGARMTYCVTKKDHEAYWSWAEPRAWTVEEWSNEISPSLNSFSRLTWGEIDGFSSESGHKMHHGHEIHQLVEEAQQRWLSLGLEQFDTVFRFRMGGTKRAWGYVVQAHFHMVWWDRNHSIYPV